jgi:NAD(P)-dependent dehydrogenase (short-subunit alcohol dehydrogenase family)
MLPEKTFDGRVAVITGGGTGIGFGIARELARLGATLVLCSRKEEHLGPAVEQLRSESGRAGAAHYHVLDVRDAEAVEAMAAKVAADHGRIDLLVNNAAGNFIAESAQLSANGWNSVIGIVLNGTFYCTSAVGKRMIEAKSGAILNVIANYAWTGAPGVVHSASAKAGVLAMTRTLAVEWARYKIRTNAIAPGPFPTEGAFSRLMPGSEMEKRARERIPARRFGEHWELTNLVAYTMSDASPYQTGDLVTIDGAEGLFSGQQFASFAHLDRGAAKELMASLKPKR